MDLGKPQLNNIYSSLFVILKRCKVQKTNFQGFQLSLLLSWLKFAESRLLLILHPMGRSYLSLMRTNDFRCVFRYNYNVNANTAGPMWTQIGAVWSGFIVFASMIKSSLKCTWIYAADVRSRAVEVPCPTCPTWSHFIQDKLKISITCPCTSTNVKI